LISVEAKITGDGYVGIPSFRASFWLTNPTEAVVMLRRIYYELFVGTNGQFLGGGEAFKRGPGDSETEVIYLCPKCKDIGVASIFELSDQKIGIIERSRAGKDAVFRLNVYGDAGIRYLDKEESQEFSYKRLSVKVDAKVPKEEWEKWLDSWMANQRVLLVKKETIEKLDEALRKYSKVDYDQLIQELIGPKDVTDELESIGKLP